MKIKPYKHQQEIMHTLVDTDEYILGWQVGAGKTLPMILMMEHVIQNSDRQRCLIVCPNSVLDNWKREIGIFAPDIHDKVAVLQGDKKKRQALLRHEDYQIFVINFEGLRVLHENLCEYDWEIMVVDELHNCKSPKSKQSKAAYLVSKKARLRFGLTGTMILNNLMDVFQQFLVIDHGKTFGYNFFSFRARYFYDINASWAGKNKYYPKWEVRPDSVDKIKALMATKMHVLLKEDCLDLPPQVFENRFCEMKGDQLRTYTSMEREMIAFLKQDVTVATTALTKILRLNQITSGHIINDDGQQREFENNAKLKLLMETVESIGEEQSIVWTIFRHDVTSILEALKAKGIKCVGFNGDTPREDRQTLINEFNSGDHQVIVCNIQTGKEGINLTAASHAIVYSMNYNLGNLLQAYGRNHRGGCEIHKCITYIHLICKGTIDEVIFNAIQRKDDLQKSVMTFLTNKQA